MTPIQSDPSSGEPAKADELVIFDFIRDKVYTRVEFVPSFEPTEVEMKIEITDDMVKRLIEAIRERPDGAMSDWLDHAINGGS